MQINPRRKLYLYPSGIKQKLIMNNKKYIKSSNIDVESVKHKYNVSYILSIKGINWIRHIDVITIIPIIIP